MMVKGRRLESAKNSEEISSDFMSCSQPLELSGSSRPKRKASKSATKALNSSLKDDSSDSNSDQSASKIPKYRTESPVQDSTSQSSEQFSPPNMRELKKSSAEKSGAPAKSLVPFEEHADQFKAMGLRPFYGKDLRSLAVVMRHPSGSLVYYVFDSAVDNSVLASEECRLFRKKVWRPAFFQCATCSSPFGIRKVDLDRPEHSDFYGTHFPGCKGFLSEYLARLVLERTIMARVRLTGLDFNQILTESLTHSLELFADFSIGIKERTQIINLVKIRFQSETFQKELRRLRGVFRANVTKSLSAECDAVSSGFQSPKAESIACSALLPKSASPKTSRLKSDGFEIPFSNVSLSSSESEILEKIGGRLLTLSDLSKGNVSKVSSPRGISSSLTAATSSPSGANETIRFILDSKLKENLLVVESREKPGYDYLFSYQSTRRAAPRNSSEVIKVYWCQYCIQTRFAGSTTTSAGGGSKKVAIAEVRDGILIRNSEKGHCQGCVPAPRESITALGIHRKLYEHSTLEGKVDTVAEDLDEANRVRKEQLLAEMSAQDSTEEEEVGRLLECLQDFGYIPGLEWLRASPSGALCREEISADANFMKTGSLRCVVKNCPNHEPTIQKRKGRRSANFRKFHPFPSERWRIRLWNALLGIDIDRTPEKNEAICKGHLAAFNPPERDIRYLPLIKTNLDPDELPSIFSVFGLSDAFREELTERWRLQFETALDPEIMSGNLALPDETKMERAVPAPNTGQSSESVNRPLDCFVAGRIASGSNPINPPVRIMRPSDILNTPLGSLSTATMRPENRGCTEETHRNVARGAFCPKCGLVIEEGSGSPVFDLKSVKSEPTQPEVELPIESSSSSDGDLRRNDALIAGPSTRKSNEEEASRNSPNYNSNIVEVSREPEDSNSELERLRKIMASQSAALKLLKFKLETKDAELIAKDRKILELESFKILQS